MIGWPPCLSTKPAGYLRDIKGPAYHAVMCTRHGGALLFLRPQAVIGQLASWGRGLGGCRGLVLQEVPQKLLPGVSCCCCSSL